MPSFFSIEQISLPEDWAWNSEFLKFRNHRTGDGQSEIAQQLQIHFKFPSSSDSLTHFLHFIYLSQVNQGICYKAQTEHYRVSKTMPVSIRIYNYCKIITFFFFKRQTHTAPCTGNSTTSGRPRRGRRSSMADDGNCCTISRLIFSHRCWCRRCVRRPRATCTRSMSRPTSTSRSPALST